MLLDSPNLEKYLSPVNIFFGGTSLDSRYIEYYLHLRMKRDELQTKLAAKAFSV